LTTMRSSPSPLNLRYSTSFLLDLATQHDLKLCSIDFSSAYLNSDLEEGVNSRRGLPILDADWDVICLLKVLICLGSAIVTYRLVYYMNFWTIEKLIQPNNLLVINIKWVVDHVSLVSQAQFEGGSCVTRDLFDQTTFLRPRKCIFCHSKWED
jgi:hypothetical protein